MKQTWILITLCACSVSCGPAYRTFYTYVPPKTVVGKGCVSQCNVMKMQCGQLEDQKLANCTQRADTAHRECERAAQAEVLACKLGGNKSCVKPYCARQICVKDHATCDAQYRVCFQNCGGKVTSETRCVARCEKE